MKVLLISPNTETLSMLSLPLGLACVGAATRAAGHDVRLLDLLFEGNLEMAVKESIAKFNPDVIGISIRNIDNQDMAHPRFLLASIKEVVAACRNASGAPIVLGGAG